MGVNKFYKFLYFDNLSKIYFYNNFYLYFDACDKYVLNKLTIISTSIIFFKNLCLTNLFSKYFSFDLINMLSFCNIFKSRVIGLLYGHLTIKSLLVFLKNLILTAKEKASFFYILIYEFYLLHFGLKNKIKTKSFFSLTQSTSSVILGFTYLRFKLFYIFFKNLNLPFF